MKGMEVYKSFVLIISFLGTCGLIYWIFQINELPEIDESLIFQMLFVPCISVGVMWVFYYMIGTLIYNIKYFFLV